MSHYLPPFAARLKEQKPASPAKDGATPRFMRERMNAVRVAIRPPSIVKCQAAVQSARVYQRESFAERICLFRTCYVDGRGCFDRLTRNNFVLHRKGQDPARRINLDPGGIFIGIHAAG